MRIDSVRVKELLAKIGISLKESKEQYLNGFEYDFRFHFLPIQIRKELSKRLTSVSDTFGLEDLYYDSFTRRYGMNEFER